MSDRDMSPRELEIFQAVKRLIQVELAMLGAGSPGALTESVEIGRAVAAMIIANNEARPVPDPLDGMLLHGFLLGVLWERGRASAAPPPAGGRS